MSGEAAIDGDTEMAIVSAQILLATAAVAHVPHPIQG
jgi:hypothetical protein